MAKKRIEKTLIYKWQSQGQKRIQETLIVEEPLTIRLNEQDIATTMRTPGHDFELAVGFLLGDERLVGRSGQDLHAEHIVDIRYCATGAAIDTEFNVVSVKAPEAVEKAPRLGVITSACGVCGTEAIDELLLRLKPFQAGQAVAAQITQNPAWVKEVISKIRPSQELFSATGAVHAAAAFDHRGEIIVLREDIGRHNAVDKVAGYLAINRIQTEGLGLFVSGRASFEMVQKAWAAGFCALISISAPSALAVQTARSANMALTGFVRADSMNVYSPEKLDLHLE